MLSISARFSSACYICFHFLQNSARSLESSRVYRGQALELRIPAQVPEAHFGGAS